MYKSTCRFGLLESSLEVDLLVFGLLVYVLFGLCRALAEGAFVFTTHREYGEKIHRHTVTQSLQ
jgi:hypothetical protein